MNFSLNFSNFHKLKFETRKILKKSFLIFSHFEPQFLINIFFYKNKTECISLQVDFPFMVVLVSGGHCLLAMAEAVDKYKLMGHCRDNAPGQVLDKVARRLKLHTLRDDLRDVSGGKAIQVLAQEGGDPTAFPFTAPLQAQRNCNFSFSGLFTHFMLAIDEIEAEMKLPHDQFIPDLPHFCAR